MMSLLSSLFSFRQQNRGDECRAEHRRSIAREQKDQIQFVRAWAGYHVPTLAQDMSTQQAMNAHFFLTGFFIGFAIS